jgi:hypothetical protein
MCHVQLSAFVEQVANLFYNDSAFYWSHKAGFVAQN